MKRRRLGNLCGPATRVILALTDERSRAKKSGWRLARRGVTAVVLLGLTLLSPGAQQVATAQAQTDSVEEAKAKIDGFMASLQSLREALDPARFDVDELSLELAFEEAETITGLVHDAIAFEPYRGALRGAAGTLASGAGNTLDQALLLSTLLNDAGYQAEIRRATLEAEAVDLLLAQLRPTAIGDEGVPAVDASALFPGVEAQDLTALAVQAERIGTELEADVARVESVLLDSVAFATGEPDDLREVAGDYFWVAYRLGDEPWTDAHPAFGETPTELVDLDPVERFQGAVPDELLHRFRFQVFVERKLGDTLEVAALTEPWERPVANLYGVALTYANLPDGLEAAEDGRDLDSVMEATNFFFPIFEGELASGAQAFDLEGNTVPPDVAVDAMAGVVQSVGRAAGGAAGALDGLGRPAEEQEAPAEFISLSAQWLEFTLIAPGGEEQVHRRMIVDRIGAQGRAAGSTSIDDALTDSDVFAALQSVHTFMLDPGRYSGGYVLDRSLDAVVSTTAYLHEVLDALAEGGDLPSYDLELAAPEEALGPLNLYQLFDAAPVEPSVVSYRPAPGLVVFSQRADGSHAQVDIVANPRRSLRLTDGGPKPDPLATLRAGLWETRTEILPLAPVGDAVSPAYDLIASAQAGEAALVVVTSQDRDRLADLPLPAETLAAMHEDLDRGYLVIAPATADPDREAVVGWWRVDLASGEALGRGGDGRGQTFVEYLTSFEVSVTITAGFAVYGVHACTAIEDPTEAGCCIVQNVVLAGAGTAIGVGLGVVYGAGAALAIFGAMDIGYNVVGTMLPTFCPF